MCNKIPAGVDSHQPFQQCCCTCAATPVQGWQHEKERVASLEKDLSFFQSALSQAISGRDSASYEAKMCQQRLEVQAAELDQCRAAALGQGSRAQQLQQELATAQQQLSSSQAELGSIKVQQRQVQSLQQQILQQQKQLAQTEVRY